VILEGKLLKIFTAAYETPFWKHDRLAIGLWSCVLFLVLRPCTDRFVWKLPRLSTTNIISDNIYWHGTGKMSNFLKKTSTWASRSNASHNSNYPFL
jgi:hypothetical protein